MDHKTSNGIRENIGAHKKHNRKYALWSVKKNKSTYRHITIRTRAYVPEPQQGRQKTPSDTVLDKAIKDEFSSTLIAAITNRDNVLRKIRDCIIQNDERRCKAVSKLVHAHWNQLSVNDGCILLINCITIPNAMKEAVIDVLRATHPGSWGMTELAHRLWWPFINRNLINKAKTCRHRTEIGKNLKSIIAKTKRSPNILCVEANEEI